MPAGELPAAVAGGQPGDYSPSRGQVGALIRGFVPPDAVLRQRSKYAGGIHVDQGTARVEEDGP
jgi:hypothetical protein